MKYSSHGLFGANVYRWRINIGTRDYGLSLYKLIKILIIKLVASCTLLDKHEKYKCTYTTDKGLGSLHSG